MWSEARSRPFQTEFFYWKAVMQEDCAFPVLNATKAIPRRRILSRCCARRERPRSRCAAEQRDELAPLHSITSSARKQRKRKGDSVNSLFIFLRLSLTWSRTA